MNQQGYQRKVLTGLTTNRQGKGFSMHTTCPTCRCTRHITCTLHALHAHYMHTTCTLHAHYMHMTRTLQCSLCSEQQQQVALASTTPTFSWTPSQQCPSNTPCLPLLEGDGLLIIYLRIEINHCIRHGCHASWHSLFCCCSGSSDSCCVTVSPAAAVR